LRLDKMEYKCDDCGHEWNLHLGILGLARCPEISCRSLNVWPKKLPELVANAMQLPGGINDSTPVQDLVNAANAVGLNDLLSLGAREFRRVCRKVVKEAEATKKRKEGRRIAVER